MGIFNAIVEFLFFTNLDLSLLVIGFCSLFTFLNLKGV